MSSIQDKAKQSEAIARASIRRLSNERLAETWMLTNGQSGRAVEITRGWLMDEMEARMNRRDGDEEASPTYLGTRTDRFDRWLAAEFAAKGEPVNPLPYLA
jgi:hypothetical protein